MCDVQDVPYAIVLHGTYMHNTWIYEEHYVIYVRMYNEYMCIGENF